MPLQSHQCGPTPSNDQQIIRDVHTLARSLEPIMAVARLPDQQSRIAVLTILFSSRAYADTTFVVRGVGALECYKWALVAGRARQDAACEPTWPDFVGRFWESRGNVGATPEHIFAQTGGVAMEGAALAETACARSNL